jgi:hypothetical protein
MAVHTFFELTLGGRAFEAVLTADGPGLRAAPPRAGRSSRGSGYVAMGVAASTVSTSMI